MSISSSGKVANLNEKVKNSGICGWYSSPLALTNPSEASSSCKVTVGGEQEVAAVVFYFNIIKPSDFLCASKLRFPLMDLEKSPATKIGQILRTLRKNSKLSQLEVSLKCDVSPRNYQEIEYGNKNCQIDTLTKILKIYNINIFTFFSSYFIDEFRDNGVEPLYEVFGQNAFGYRKFDLQGTVIYQCPYSRLITGMSDDEVVGKMKVWSDLTDPSMVMVVRAGLKMFLKLQPTPPSWKVDIKNHRTHTTNPFMGFMRYSRDPDKKLTGIEIIIFPLDKLQDAL